MVNTVCWDHDKHTFRVYSDGVLVLQTPFPTTDNLPTAVLAIDPGSGVPIIYPISTLLGGGVEVPGGSLGDILYHDGTNWVTLTPGAIGDTLILVGNGDGRSPLWSSPTTTTTTQVVTTSGPNKPTLADQQCGAAKYCTERLIDGYYFGRRACEAALQAYSGDVNAVISLLTGFVGTSTIRFVMNFAGGVSTWNIPVIAFDLVLLAGNTFWIQNSVHQNLGTLKWLTPGHFGDIWRMIYCALADTADIRLSIVLPQIKSAISHYIYWLSPVQATILNWVLDTEAANWDEWAVYGALDGSKAHQNPNWTCPVTPTPIPSSNWVNNLGATAPIGITATSP